ncbi:hypothetical protein [Oryza sativa Japonica Group]|uniref:Uncharacterized protein n=1 Tax=Oryza sativa subsp. japonica TaxID=39947 RepID=Q5SN50_ORYSJ|nr:hypothetical protein [Oryza sativa Japonica Group]
MCCGLRANHDDAEGRGTTTTVWCRQRFSSAFGILDSLARGLMDGAAEDYKKSELEERCV